MDMKKTCLAAAVALMASGSVMAADTASITDPFSVDGLDAEAGMVEFGGVVSAKPCVIGVRDTEAEALSVDDMYHYVTMGEGGDMADEILGDGLEGSFYIALRECRLSGMPTIKVTSGTFNENGELGLARFNLAGISMPEAAADISVKLTQDDNPVNMQNRSIAFNQQTPPNGNAAITEDNPMVAKIDYEGTRLTNALTPGYYWGEFTYMVRYH